MKCAKINLQERTKAKAKPHLCYTDKKPLRYCQKRMINPEHDEGPRWVDYASFRHHENYYTDESGNSSRNQDPDMFLTVQTLKFQGNIDPPKRLRNGFKYKSASTGDTHRMFVKQVIPDEDDSSDDGRSSQLTSYYFEDYVKYLFNNDKSRPSSGKSSMFLQSLSNKKENKATQVDEHKVDDNRNKTRHGSASINETLLKNPDKRDIKIEESVTEDTKIIFHNNGRRKSLTISRTQSPESVQVIRVDVVRNNSHGSAMSDYEDKKIKYNAPLESLNLDDIDMKKPHFANKYLLTNTIKALDENCGREKVTLLCKTFKLSDRSEATPLNNKHKNNKGK